MTLENILLGYLNQYQILVIFIGTFLFGDTIVISLAFFAEQGALSLSSLIIFGFLGTVISDSIWFFMSKYLCEIKYIKKKIFQNKKLVKTVDKLTGKKPLLFLIFAKFLYGTRIIFIIYLSIKKLKYLKFLLYNSIGTVIWLLTLIFLGWFSAKGAVNLIPIFKDAQYLLMIALVLALVIKGITIWLTDKIKE